MEQVRSLLKNLKKRPDFFKAAHETVIILLAIISLVFAIHDIYYAYNAWMQGIDLCIWAVFTGDYLFRMGHTRNKWRFFLHNIPDLLTILPFAFALQALRFARVSELSLPVMAIKCLRAVSFLVRILKYCMKIMRTHGIRFVILVTALVVAAGGVAIHYIEGLPIVDSLWWAFVTAATVGYGDLSPATGAGRIVAVLLMVVGIGLIGSLTSTITSAVLRAHQQATVQSEVKDLLTAKLNHVESLDDEEVEQLCEMIRALHRASGPKEPRDAAKADKF